MKTQKDISTLRAALPFWISLSIIPVFIISMYLGRWWVLTPYIYLYIAMSILDAIKGLNTYNADPNTKDQQLFWYRLITIIWLPIQIGLIFASIYILTQPYYYTAWEIAGLLLGLGIISGTIGIVYAHELIHQSGRFERHLGDGLLALSLYSHFRTEHLLVHHRHVGTPKDYATARYNQGFHQYFRRVLFGSLRSAWAVEHNRLAQRGLPAWHPYNPFWKYAFLQGGCIGFSYMIGGWMGVCFFIIQAYIAIILLEITNYIEHYGLTREHLGNGKYEPVKPHHSWNASQMVTNFLMINLQRHSDHHYKPSRRFPLLQHYPKNQAPQLPRGYPIMGFFALIPPLWRYLMNPKVRAWRKQFYPHISDWTDYNKGTTPKPK